MVKALVNLTEYENRIINIVKAKYGFRTKTEAIKWIIHEYEEEFLEPELRPEFIERMEKREKEEIIEVKDLRKHFGLE